MEQMIRLDTHDNLECMSIQGQQSAFPFHFHQTYCISLIRTGTENLKTEHLDIAGEAGSITIAHPLEVHANPLMSTDINLGFDTIYLSPDLVRHFIPSPSIPEFSRKIVDPLLNSLFRNLKADLYSKIPTHVDQSLRQFLNYLKQYQQPENDFQEAFPSATWEELIAFIDAELMSKIKLESLARNVGMDKYNFSKRFRSTTGMSPMQYVLMQKVFAAKGDIAPSSELTTIAYNYDFTDMAHFSRTFKRFVGVSPRIFQKGLG